ncbi:MAG TPA: GTPase Era [Syntrophales bacterium]|jgi:GTP-binding protein Era|nr:GTPase Era [Syntrophales bacterium]HQA83163.1 GTPase Era [Syntrophales bacterium]
MFKSGFIGIIGRPNVGKSTLMNHIVGEKIAITTPKPQTTRNRIMGIHNRGDGQFIFIDTPGIHEAFTTLNRLMVDTAVRTFGSTDLLLLLIEADKGVQRGDRQLIESLEGNPLPVILGINKIDLIKKDLLLPLIDELRKLFPFEAIIPLSALDGRGMDVLLDEIWKHLPEGAALFPEDMMTDRTERFITAEVIREKIILLTHQEIPYATAVTVDSFKEDEDHRRIRIAATITVEKDSQKGILIGKKGSMLKQIGSLARTDLEIFFASRIFLQLFVRVRKDWTQDRRMLQEFGYTEE